MNFMTPLGEQGLGCARREKPAYLSDGEAACLFPSSDIGLFFRKDVKRK